MFKKIYLNKIAAILELTAISSLKRRIRDGNIPGITEAYREQFSIMSSILSIHKDFIIFMAAALVQNR